MKTSTVLLLCAISATLLVGAYFGKWFGASPKEVAPLPQLSFNTTDVQAIAFHYGENTEKVPPAWTAQRRGEEWYADSTKIDNVAIDSLLYQLSHIKLLQQVTDKIEEQSVYGFGNQPVTHLSLKGGFGTKNLYFSQVTDKGQFLRIENNAQIYALAQPFTFPKSALDVKHRFLFTLAVNQVTHVEVKSLDERFSLSLEDNEWVLDRDTSVVLADSMMVMMWLKRFAPLEADGFTSTILSNTINRRSPFTIDFFNKKISLGTLFLRKQDGKMYGVFENSQEVFYFTEATANHLFPLAELFTQETDAGGFVQDEDLVEPEESPNP